MGLIANIAPMNRRTATKRSDHGARLKSIHQTTMPIADSMPANTATIASGSEKTSASGPTRGATYLPSTSTIDLIEPPHLPPTLTHTRKEESSASVVLTPGMTVDEAETRLIKLTLEHTRDNKTRAAEILGISLKTLHNKLNRLKAQAASVLGGSEESSRADG